MREPKENLFAQMWSGLRRIPLIALFAVSLTLLIVALGVATAVLGETSTGDSSAPWIPDDQDTTSFLTSVGLTAAVAMTLGWLGGYVSETRRLRRGRCGHWTEPQKITWRYREMSRREKRRLAVAFMLSGSFISVPVVLFGSDGDPGNEVLFWVLLISGGLGSLTGLVVALVQVRPSRTVMQIVEGRLKDEREQMARELASMREADAREMDRFKNEAIAVIFEQVMGQVESGVITCSKCAEFGAAHAAGESEITDIPEPRQPEGTDKTCLCGGPTSMSLVYFPPRFQSRRTAS